MPDALKAILPDSICSWHVDEIYNVGVYGKPDLTGKVVIDVRAAIGDTALYLYARGAERVYAFEIDKDRAELARENISLIGLEGRIIVYDEPGTPDSIDHIIKSTTPDDRLFFLKLDCEGCEYELLRELLSKNSQSRIDEVVLEYHGQVAPLLNYLEKAGFDKPIVNTKTSIIHAKRNVVNYVRTP